VLVEDERKKVEGDWIFIENESRLMYPAFTSIKKDSISLKSTGLEVI